MRLKSIKFLNIKQLFKYNNLINRYENANFNKFGIVWREIRFKFVYSNDNY